jgi:hypothetical protein
MKKLYLACALTNVPDDKRVDFEKLIFWLKTELSKSFEILEFVGIGDLLNPNPMSPQEVYEVDMLGRVMKTDYLLAICDYPATGLGYEIGVAAEKRGIPVVVFAHKDAKVSRSIIGVTLPNYHFFRYDSPEQILAQTLSILTM